MRKKLLVLALFAAIAFPVSNHSQSALNQTYVRKPDVSIDEALAIGKKYVEQKKIDVSQYYIDYARLNLNPRGDRGKFWELRWERNEGAAKGDYILLNIFMDKSVERIAAK